MGRPELRSDCADLEWFQQDQNIVCSRKLLEALRSTHGRGDVETEVEPVILSVAPEPAPKVNLVPDTEFQFAPHKVDIIKRLVCEHFKISKANIESSSRRINLVRPRQIAMYLARRFTHHSFPEIGRRFGGRDHTTILHAERKIAELCGRDTQVAADVAELEAALS